MSSMTGRFSFCFNPRCSTGIATENEDTRKCGRCQFARYCSVKCQAQDYASHKKDCALAGEVKNQMDSQTAMDTMIRQLVVDSIARDIWFLRGLASVALPFGCMVCRFKSPGDVIDFHAGRFQDMSKVDRRWHPIDKNAPDSFRIPGVQSYAFNLVQKTMQKMIIRKRDAKTRFVVLFVIENLGKHPLYGIFDYVGPSTEDNFAITSFKRLHDIAMSPTPYFHLARHVPPEKLMQLQLC